MTELLGQVGVGLSSDQQKMLLEILHKTTGENYFIGKKKKKSDGVKFVQLIMENINFLNEIGYLKPSEESFLFKLTPYIEFKSNVLIEKVKYSDVDIDESEVTTSALTPTYLSKEFKFTRKHVSSVMNSLLEKGVLGVAEAGMTTEDGRVCTSRTWFVNPNIMCCSPKDGIDKATQHIFKRSLRNFKIDGSNKKHRLPVYLF
ncbi:MarR family transcriptional regulator (plasmid) [Bacillus sp. JZ8]